MTDFLLTASPEFFTGKTEEQIREWEQKSLEWVCKKFPPGAVKACIAHRDEACNHLSLLVLPVYKQKLNDRVYKQTLNARHYTGGREKMRALWTEYAEAMKPYGLERGKEYSPAKHKDIKAYYADIRKGKELATVRKVRAEELPAPELSDRMNPRQYASDLINRVTAFIRQENGNLRAGLQAEREKLEKLTRQMQKDRELYNRLKESPEAFRELQEAIKREAGKRMQEQEKYKRLLEAIRQYFRQNIPKNSPLRKGEKLGHLQDFPELQRDIALSLAPDARERERQDMERVRG